MTHCAHFAIMVALAIASATVTQAAEYFVAPDGDNMNSGSSTSPWETLQHAANLVASGDRVTVRPGEYAGFDLRTSGTSNAPIEFFAEPGALITAPNSVTDRDGINLERASHVLLDGFSVTGMDRAGIRVVGSSASAAEFVTVRNIRAYDNRTWGIFTGFVDDLLIESNFTSGSEIEHGIYVSNSGDRPVVRDNTIWENNANGIHLNGDESQGGDGIISGALISGNRIYDNGRGGGSGINMDGVQDSRIENNLLYNNHASGISLYRIDGGAPSTGNVVVNNTVHQASDGRWAMNVRNDSTDNTLLNNIFVSEHSLRGAINASEGSVERLVSDYNVVISRFTTTDGDSIVAIPAWQSQTGNDLNSHVADAADLFIDPDSGDYRLLETAIAVNAGASTFAPLDDIAGQPRPAGAAIDIGAYERPVAGVTGDYNGDGAAGAADFTVWRDTRGATVAPYSGADGDGSGQVDAQDYTAWKTNFGATAEGLTGGTTVPEPPSILLIAAVSIVTLCRFQLRR